MPKGDKYITLTNWLKHRDEDSITLSFDEVRDVLGFLPPVAIKDRAYWANDKTQSSSYGWMNAGYKTMNVRMKEQEVTFKKVDDFAADIYQKEVCNNNDSTSNETYVPTPCCEEVDKYLAKWKTLRKYTIQESALNKLFLKTYPQNTDLDDVLIKATALNAFYSTNIYNITPVAELIVGLNIDKRLGSGDITLVDEIAFTKLESGMPNRYSFATKYCSHHQPIYYPIYDGYVDKMLCYFGRVHGFLSISRESLYNYTTFKDALCVFQKYYGLDKYNLKQIDQYLWQLGKEKFPKKY